MSQEKTPSGKSLRKASRGALSLIVALLVGSAVLRLASGTGAAIAREVQNGANPIDQTGVSAPLTDQDHLAAMLAAFQEREQRLEEQERDLASRQAKLDDAQSKIAEQMQALIQVEDSLRATLSLAEGASEKDLSQLTSVYENMKPKEAAALFEEMAPEFAAGFIGRMRADAAAGIMAGLSPQAAYSISAVMAGRHNDVPTE